MVIIAYFNDVGTYIVNSRLKNERKKRGKGKKKKKPEAFYKTKKITFRIEKI